MSTLATGTATPVQAPKVEEDLWTPTDDDHPSGYCIATKPFPCPRPGCDFVANHVTASHLILCWPEIDDPKMLALAAHVRDFPRSHGIDRDPRIVEYAPSLGPGVSFYEWERVGRPAHNTPGIGDQGPVRPL